MSQPHVIVIGGPNGAGKSTIAPLVLRDYLAVPDFVASGSVLTLIHFAKVEYFRAYVSLCTKFQKRTKIEQQTVSN